MHTAAFLAASLDGFIAREDGALDWLPQPEAEGEDYGYTEFFARIDALVMGRRTFEVVSGFTPWPYGDKPVVVLSRTLTPADLPVHLPLRLHAGPLLELLRQLEAEGVRRVYADGGQVVQEFIRAGRLNELTLTTVPVLLGRGRPLFGAVGEDVPLELLESRSFAGGLVQSRYAIAGRRVPDGEKGQS
ncbi:bifunctional deaminase-reductase domain protein (plasmid) [Deinococcus proteolyticus MRP]|uniref:Bifunctional deaminase-reductase domain protein n=1 Tax=Deinococcus proteolyticus (strain ATCC 35074 / DSM 20540 / JCM 6276 / NBRC 101906 / NCIMB 13154 / VKM Ac-1939 / CCM 2703 / MRP) TaxID=693977 RepID=F0RRA9_DEIPM|nr:dihydrofolate reductase family protein [Deinococcus proteolyticus]ADY27818.1 bifunctional deaminase-reductase domain protein [Deinococcus proteolyticus MRP]